MNTNVVGVLKDDSQPSDMNLSFALTIFNSITSQPFAKSNQSKILIALLKTLSTIAQGVASF